MQYLFAFVVLMGLGLGVNFLMLRFMKNHLNRRIERSPADDDSLTVEMKDELNKEIEALKSVVQEIMNDIKTSTQELEAKQMKLEETIARADERIAEIAGLHREAQDIDGELMKGGTEPDFRRVYELHRSGMSHIEIARTMDLGLGEVQLILGLLSKAR